MLVIALNLGAEPCRVASSAIGFGGEDPAVDAIWTGDGEQLRARSICAAMRASSSAAATTLDVRMTMRMLVTRRRRCRCRCASADNPGRRRGTSDSHRPSSSSVCLPRSSARLWSSDSRLISSSPASPVKPDRERDFARLVVEIVHEQHRIVAPVVAHHQHRADRALQITLKSPQPTSGTSLRMRMMRSVQFSIELGSRRCLAALTCSIAVRALVDHRHEPACRFR